MTKTDIIRKLTSRKLWLAVCSFVSLLVVALGHTESEAAQVTALIMAGASVLAYIIGEGLIDAAGAGLTTEYEYEYEDGDDDFEIGFTPDDDIPARFIPE